MAEHVPVVAAAVIFTTVFLSVSEECREYGPAFRVGHVAGLGLAVVVPVAAF